MGSGEPLIGGAESSGVLRCSRHGSLRPSGSPPSVAWRTVHKGSSPSLGVADRGENVLLGGGQGVQLTHLAHDAAKAAALIPMGHPLHRHAVPQPTGIGRGESRSASRPLRPESFLQAQRSSSASGSAAGSSADSPIKCRSMPRPRGWRCSYSERGRSSRPARLVARL